MIVPPSVCAHYSMGSLGSISRQWLPGGIKRQKISAWTNGTGLNQNQIGISRPCADFTLSPYSVIISPTKVAFRLGWLKRLKKKFRDNKKCVMRLIFSCSICKSMVKNE